MSTETLEGIRLANRYTIEKMLGQGGMGDVYLVSDSKLSKKWALKRQKPLGEETSQESLKAEADLMAGLNHKCLAQVVDFFLEDDCEHLVMEYCKGETLDTLLQFSRLPVDRAIDLAEQLGDTLRYLHSRPDPVIFRDLKPQNIIITEDGTVKLIDFGIARARRRESFEDTQALGTPGYAAPEQYGKGKSDARSDIFGLGATIHHALTGVNPAENPFSFPPLSKYRSSVPLIFERFLDKSIALNPDDRFQTAEEFLDQLELLKHHRDMRSILAPPGGENERDRQDDSGELKFRIALEEKQLKIQELETVVAELEKSLSEMEKTLSDERDKSRALAARKAVEERSVALELEKALSQLDVQSKNLELEATERHELEKELSEVKARSRSLEVELLRFKETFQKASQECSSMLSERDQKIQQFSEAYAQLQAEHRRTVQLVQEKQDFLDELSRDDGGLEVAQRRINELENQIDELTRGRERAHNERNSALSQMEAMRLETDTILKAYSNGKSSSSQSVESGATSARISDLEERLELTIALWLQAEASLKREVAGVEER